MATGLLNARACQVVSVKKKLNRKLSPISKRPLRDTFSLLKKMDYQFPMSKWRNSMDNEQYLTEVREALEHDNTRLGDVWRLTNKGKSATEIAEELNVSTNNFVYGYQKFIQAIEEGNLPKSPMNSP